MMATTNQSTFVLEKETDNLIYWWHHTKFPSIWLLWTQQSQ